MTIGHFLNTRPADRAAPLTQALERADWRVTELPLLELIAMPLSKEDRDVLCRLASQSLQQQAVPTVVVVVSPMAAHLGLEALTQLNIVAHQSTVHWLAVGSGTAEVLKAAGIDAETPEIETSEGLIASPSLSTLTPGQTVMVWRGIGGRELVQAHLLNQGIEVFVVNLYQRQFPKASQRLWYDICAKNATSNQANIKKSDNLLPDVVLLSSGESWRYWQELAGVYACQPWLLVMGQRLLTEVQRLTPRVRVLDSLKPEHILKVLTELKVTF